MGLIIKFLALSAASIWSVRAIGRLNSKISRISVPRSSSLAQFAKDRGDIYADTFTVKLPSRIAAGSNTVTVAQLTRAFFCSRVFCSFEKPLLKLVYQVKEPDLTGHFDLGDKVFAWKVVYRSKDEILLQWDVGRDVSGLTWLHVTTGKDQVMLGSSIGYSSRKASYPRSDVSPLALVYPLDQSLLKKGILKSVTFAGLIGIHQLYSRLLLSSALRTLVLQEEE
jgi:hypothetical protein